MSECYPADGCLECNMVMLLQAEQAEQRVGSEPPPAKHRTMGTC